MTVTEVLTLVAAFVCVACAVLICVLVGCYIAEKYDDRNPPLP